MLQKKIRQNLSEEAYFKCIDHTVSGAEFSLRYNPEFDMLVTFPAPEDSELPEFYKSDAYISHTDSRKSLFEKVYQKVKSYMLSQKLKWIEEETSVKGNLLDIGAGTGDFLARAKKEGWDIEGVEPNAEARDLAAKKGVSLSASSSHFDDASFDVITMWHVLEHVSDLETQLQELKRLLKKDGLLVIAVPNFKSYDAYKYKESWAAFDVPRHLWHFSQNSIERIFAMFSFELEKVAPLKFDSFYVSLLSEKYKTGPKNVFKGFLNGMVSNFIGKKTKEYSSLVYFLKNASEIENKAI